MLKDYELAMLDVMEKQIHALSDKKLLATVGEEAIDVEVEARAREVREGLLKFIANARRT